MKKELLMKSIKFGFAAVILVVANRLRRYGPTSEIIKGDFFEELFIAVIVFVSLTIIFQLRKEKNKEK